MTPAQRAVHVAENLFDLKQKAGPGLCGVKGCRRDEERRKMGLCHCHHQQRWRMKSPKKSAYATLRDHAKARGIGFTISPDYFEGLCDAHARFVHVAETRGEQLTIDRVHAHLPYQKGNLQVMTHSENSAKGNRERFLPAYVQAILDRKRARIQQEEPGFAEKDENECPF